MESYKTVDAKTGVLKYRTPDLRSGERRSQREAAVVV